MEACPVKQAIKTLVDFFKANADDNGKLKDGELKTKMECPQFKEKMEACKAKMKAGECCDMTDVDKFGLFVAGMIKCNYEGKQMCEK